MTDLTAQCPTGCGRPVGVGKLLCGPCWSRVPKHLQTDVYRTWRSWRKDFSDADALVAYRQAREAALAAIA